MGRQSQEAIEDLEDLPLESKMELPASSTPTHGLMRMAAHPKASVRSTCASTRANLSCGPRSFTPVD
jgi:hypothetical protein